MGPILQPFLRRVDPAALELVEEITTDSTAGGAATVVFGSIWRLSTPDDQAVYRVRP